MLSPLLLSAWLSSGAPPAATPTGTCTLTGRLTVTDAAGKPFVPEHAEVYVDTPLPLSPRLQKWELVQEGRAFVPRVLVVEQHDTVVFTNRDPFPHEIHAERVSNAFGSGTNRKPETFRLDFTQVGESTLGCRLHPGMRGTILTVPNAFHVKVAPDGTWRLTGLPQRPLKLNLWQYSDKGSSFETRQVTPCSQTAPLEVTIRGASPARTPPYGGGISTD